MSELLVNTIKKADGTGSLSVPAESGTVVTTASPSVGRRNILINSAFQVSQRGDFTSASSSINGAYFVDRWLSAQDVITANKQHLRNQTITSDITAHTLKITATSSGTGNFQLSQPIERVDQELGNKTLTYSVWVKTNNSNVRLRGIFDDSGWTQFNAVHTGDGTWQKLSTTITTGPTRSAGHYQVQVLAYNNGNVSITSGDYIEIAQPQLEIGSVATPFEYRSYGEELALCQRYYEQSDRTTAGGNREVQFRRYSVMSTFSLYSNSFFVQKRATPTIVVYDSAGTANRVNVNDNISDPNNVTPTSAAANNTRSMYVQVQHSNNINGFSYNYSADAEL